MRKKEKKQFWGLKTIPPQTAFDMSIKTGLPYDRSVSIQ
jgi:hypothetical protein